jgi:hypothetical protein
MSDDTGFQAKDVAVVGPLLTTSLAITWEVGRFIPTGGFELFSLSDHLVAAVVAIPLALGIAAFFALTFLMLGSLNKYLGNRSPRGKYLSVWAAGGTIGAVATISIYKGGPFRPLDFVIAAALFFFAANIAWLGHRMSSRVGLTWLFLLSMLVSLTASSDKVQRELLEIDKGEKPASTITTKSSGTFNAHILMTGERGLLTYRPETKSIFFSAQMTFKAWNGKTRGTPLRDRRSRQVSFVPWISAKSPARQLEDAPGRATASTTSRACARNWG